MITIEQYVGPHAKSKDWTPARQAKAVILLECVNALEEEMAADGILFPDNPATGTGVSGKTFGGFRPQDCPQGAPTSSHKEGEGVDRFDPQGAQDAWLLADYLKHKAAGTVDQCALARHGLYIEHPSATSGWSHLSTRPPGSGNRVFYP